MYKPKVFIGSSSEGETVAKAIQAELGNCCDCTIWSQGLFAPGEFTWETLLSKAGGFDFSIFVFRGDDWIVRRGTRQMSPRDNVLLEFGIFSEAQGRDRAFVFHEEGTYTEMPADLRGLTFAPYRRPSDGTFQAARASVATACATVKDRIDALGHRTETIGQVRVRIPSRNLPGHTNEFRVGLLRPHSALQVNGAMLVRGAEALAEQFRTHSSAITPDLIIGVNPTGAVLASYLDGLRCPDSPWPVGSVITAGRIDGRRELRASLPNPNHLPRINSILVVDSEYKTGGSVRQIVRLLERSFGVTPSQVFLAVLCLCGVNNHQALRATVDVQEVFERSRHTPAEFAQGEQMRDPDSFAPFAYPDLIAFLASEGISPVTGR